MSYFLLYGILISNAHIMAAMTLANLIYMYLNFELHLICFASNYVFSSRFCMFVHPLVDFMQQSYVVFIVTFHLEGFVATKLSYIMKFF